MSSHLIQKQTNKDKKEKTVDDTTFQQLLHNPNSYSPLTEQALFPVLAGKPSPFLQRQLRFSATLTIPSPRQLGPCTCTPVRGRVSGQQQDRDTHATHWLYRLDFRCSPDRHSLVMTVDAQPHRAGCGADSLIVCNDCVAEWVENYRDLSQAPVTPGREAAFLCRIPLAASLRTSRRWI